MKVFAELTVTELIQTDDGAISGAFGYWRETGKFVMFKAPAVVLATGGIGKSFKVTSNSWECTGDGMGLALRAGSTLLNMEFVQFHPTGMVWPPSVKGILVTEGVRGDGGVLKNSESKRFMFDYVPDVFRKQYADNIAEADGWYKDPDHNKRTPDLLPRDEVARAINSEVKAGRGSPHGGVFLDIASRLPKEEILKRLPSMYHQFKELADVDITAEPMEVGPTCHYVMGGIEVDADTAAASRVPGLFASGEVAGGMHGSNRLGGNSLSDLLVFGRRSGEGAAAYVKALNGKYPAITDEQLEACDEDRAGADGDADGENAYDLHEELQQVMNDLVGIIRKASEVEDALERLEKLKERAAAHRRPGGREFNPGWHLALDLRNMLADRRVRRPGRADPRGVARRPHARRLPEDVAGVAPGQPDLLAERDPRRHRRREAADGADAPGPARPVQEGRAEEVLHRRGDRRRSPTMRPTLAESKRG